MIRAWILIFILNLFFIMGCQNSTSPSNDERKITSLEDKNLIWHSNTLLDLPNQPEVFVASDNGVAYMAMVDKSGKSLTAIASLEEKKLILTQRAFDIKSIKPVDKSSQITTYFSSLKRILIESHEQAKKQCRSTQFSQSIRNDAYEKRDGLVLLKLKGPWVQQSYDFEIAIALSPKSGEFVEFVITKLLMASSVSFFSAPKNLILSDVKANVVRDYSSWISTCQDAYEKTLKNHYKITEDERRDLDASAIIELDIRLGLLQTPIYEFNEITLDTLNSKELK